MAREKDTSADLPEEPGGTLADAISAHLDLKREHGADPEELEQEQREALAPARREVEPPVAPPAPELAAAPPVEAVAPPPEPEPAPEPEPEPETEPQPIVESAPAPTVAEPEPEPSPAVREMAAQDTGTFEFEWGDESSPPEPETESIVGPTADSTDQRAPDVLEQTPEFFEETPEYDKLWFEERPPREFDF